MGWVRFQSGARDFSLCHSVETGSGAHKASCHWVPGVKRAGREAEHSIYCRGQERWSCTSTPLYVFMARCVIKYRHNFTFTWRPNVYFIHILIFLKLSCEVLVTFTPAWGSFAISPYHVWNVICMFNVFHVPHTDIIPPPYAVLIWLSGKGKVVPVLN
jgi:hypothetical protein